MSNTIEFSNYCNHSEYHCQECDTYSILEPSEPSDTCPNCGSEEFEELGDVADCGCVEGNYDFAQEIWETWADKNPAPYGWYICDGKGLGWQNRSGLKPLKADVDNILQEFSLDTLWTMYFPTLQDAKTVEEFHITRSHHDAQAESIVIKPADFSEAVWCIENSPELGDVWIGEIQTLMDQEYEIGTLSDEEVIEICENVDLDPANYVQDPEKYGFTQENEN